MSKMPFSWMYGDPAEFMDRMREMRKDMEQAEKQIKERARIKKSRRIRKLVKLAMAGKLKGRS